MIASTENSDDVQREQQAKELERIGNRLFLLRLGLTVILLAWFQFSGASATLAEGLHDRFAMPWLANGIYFLVTFFGYSAFTFPLSLYGDFWLDQKFDLSNQSFGGWMWDYIKSLILSLTLTAAFFIVIYLLLAQWPEKWWIAATVFYVLVAVVMATLAPVVIMPLFHKFEELETSSLTGAVSDFIKSEGLKVIGVFKWGLEEKTKTANAALAGLGKTRRIILGDTMLDDYTEDEIIAVLAHEVGHYKNKDIPRLLFVSTLLTAVGFYVSHLALKNLTTSLGFSSIADVGAFPVFMFVLFLFSLITMPITNTYSRKREFAADAYAVRATGRSDALISALEKLATQNLSDKDPSRFVEVMLHSHPSVKRRVASARSVDLT